MNDSLKLNMFFPSEVLSITSVDYDDSSIHIKMQSKSCIQEFREIFQKKNMPYLYLFIEKYKNSDLKELSRFASGLEKDLSAVENAVASPLSNGFVEGTNSKLKMIKRTMYGRCGKELLTAKLILLKE